MKAQKEIWVDILEFDSQYQISNFGNVKSKERKVNSFIHKDGKRVLKSCEKKIQDNGKGYKQVYVKVNGKRTVKYVHRLVAKYFIPNLESKKYVNHINGIKSDNAYTNLEWVTIKENAKHAKDNKLYSKGETSGTNKLNEKQVLEIRDFFKDGKRVNILQLSRRYGVRDSTIHKIINRQTWAHI